MEANHQRKIKTARKPKENNQSTADETRAKVKTKKTAQQQTPALLTMSPALLQKPSLSRKHAGNNWNTVLAAINAMEDTPTTPNETEDVNKTENSPQGAVKKHRNHRKKYKGTVVVAMDCEMVGTGPMGTLDMLARVSIVSRNGTVLLDKFVKPQEPVTDYRTSISGIRPHDIEHAEEFEKVQDEVVNLLQGKILVGHGIHNDLAVLFIKHPHVNVRDTARYKPLARIVSNGRTPSLKRLSQAILGVEIQKGEHNSVEDARAAMNIYNRLSADWERYIHKQNRSK